MQTIILMILAALPALSFPLSLSQYCTTSSNSATISQFDIPFQNCSKTNFTGITLTTDYSAILRYAQQHRSLRLDGGLHLIVTNVTDGLILQAIDIGFATLELRLTVPTISTNVRINRSAGARLIVYNGSLQTRFQRLLRVIHTNDIHCAYQAGATRGTIGLATLLGYVRDERAKAEREGYSVLFLDAGDYLQGQTICSLSWGFVGVGAMNVSGYDAVTIGNHFWDFNHTSSWRNWQEIQKMGIPQVCANVDDQTPNERIVFPEYVVKEQNGVRIGIFGLTTPETLVSTGRKNVENVTFDKDIVGISKRIVQKLRSEERCDIVILIGHLGFEAGYQWSSDLVARNFDGIDLIVDGHSHTEIESGAFILHNDYQTMIVQTGYALQRIGRADLLIDVGARKVIGKRAKLLAEGDLVEVIPDGAAEEFVNNAVEAIASIAGELVGHSLIELTNDRARESPILPLTLLFAASGQTSAGSDFCLVNGGSMRATISAGPVTVGDLINANPFSNQYYVFNVSGVDVKRIAAYGTRTYGEEANWGGFATIIGLGYTIDLSKPENDQDRITNLVKIDWVDGTTTPILPEAYYTFATLDFLYTGGDGYQVFEGLPKIGEAGDILLCVKDFIKALPDATITGNEPFFTGTLVDVIGAPQRVRRATPRADYGGDGGTVYVANLFDATGFGSSDDLFFDFRVQAGSFLSSSTELLKRIASPPLGYVTSRGVILANAEGQFLGALDLNDSALPITLEPTDPSEHDVTSDVYRVGFIVVLVFLILSIISLVVLAVLYCRRVSDQVGFGAMKP
jgi:2',3'-cyclic-nucleotide 2'-phosphodiesterase (5'-nucleotidase family)